MLPRAVVTNSNARILTRTKWSQAVKLIIGSLGPFQRGPKNPIDETLELTILQCKMRLLVIFQVWAILVVSICDIPRYLFDVVSIEAIIPVRLKRIFGTVCSRGLCTMLGVNSPLKGPWKAYIRSIISSPPFPIWPASLRFSMGSFPSWRPCAFSQAIGWFISPKRAHPVLCCCFLGRYPKESAFRKFVTGIVTTINISRSRYGGSSLD